MSRENRHSPKAIRGNGDFKLVFRNIMRPSIIIFSQGDYSIATHPSIWVL